MSAAPPGAGERPILFDREATPAELSEIAARLSRCAAVRASARAAPVARSPFLLLTPLGAPARGDVLRAGAERGARVLRARPVPDWPEASTGVHGRGSDEARLRITLAFEWIWRELFPGGAAERWELDPMAGYLALSRDKPRLRSEIPGLRLRVSLPSLSFRTVLHPFHLPDPDQLAEEAAWMDGCLEGGERR